MTSYHAVKLEIAGRVATLTLNRPEKRNAISGELIEELLAALDEAETGGVRALILTGAGSAFCSGMDLDALRAISTQSKEQKLEDSRRMAQMFLRLYRFAAPTIAAVNGAAIAGGCGLATLCDFTLAVPEAKFGYSEARIGFIPALVAVFLRRQIGEKRVGELLLSARIFDAAEAQLLGLVTEVVAAEKLLDRARELAGSLLELSPTSLARTKQLLRGFAGQEMEREIEMAVEQNAAIRATADFREGLAAFLEKRKPQW